jgi:hypothetical protein
MLVLSYDGRDFHCEEIMGLDNGCIPDSQPGELIIGDTIYGKRLQCWGFSYSNDVNARITTNKDHGPYLSIYNRDNPLMSGAGTSSDIQLRDKSNQIINIDKCYNMVSYYIDRIFEDPYNSGELMKQLYDKLQKILSYDTIEQDEFDNLFRPISTKSARNL